MTKQDSNNAGAQASVKELEAAVKRNPDDLELKLELLGALINRHAFAGGTKGDIDRLRQIVRTLPKDRGYYARAYLAWLDQDLKRAAEWLRQALLSAPDADPQPLDSGDLLAWLVPFGYPPPNTLCRAMADAASTNWPDSTPALTLRGLVRAGEKDFLGAIDCFASALDRDETFWLAAWECANTFAAQKNCVQRKVIIDAR